MLCPQKSVGYCTATLYAFDLVAVVVGCNPAMYGDVVTTVVTGTAEEARVRQ